MKTGKVNILIGGPAGTGIEKSGRTLTLSFVRGGYHVFANVEHMSQIRGGNNYLRIRVDEKPWASHVEEIDIIIALDRKTVEEHVGEMSEGGVIVYDNEIIKLPEDFDPGRARLIDVPIRKLATDELKNPIMANVIAIGMVCGFIGFDISVLQDVLGEIFAKKGEEVIELNRKAAQIGHDLALERGATDLPVEVPKREPLGKMFITGNEATAAGAVKAGCTYVGEYPMTPSSGILHFMAKWAHKYGIVVKHTEDEIAACNSAIGAGWAGARAMTGTSGGGFALMTEAVGLAAMNEVPVVIVDVMRPGPATGLPTRGDQGDLRQLIHAGQGDPVKLVILPGNIEECFSMGFEAFNLAEKYQIPVLIGYDRHLGESFTTVASFDESGLKIDRGKLLTQAELDGVTEYKRYERTEDGVSPRAIPGQKGGVHRATSDEHDEYGDIDEASENRILMVDKRAKKMEVALAECPKPELFGESDADITFIVWGSTKGICLEAMEILQEKGVSANVLQIKTAWPFHTKEVTDILNACKRPVNVEHNYTAQMAGLIAEHTGIIIKDKVLRYDGRPMTAKYVIDKLNL